VERAAGGEGRGVGQGQALVEEGREGGPVVRIVEEEASLLGAASGD